MADQISVSVGRQNSDAFISLAVEHGLGVELMAFAYPDVLDDGWMNVLQRYKQLLRQVKGAISIHAPFMDLVSGSPDERINQVCRERYLQTISICAELGAPRMIVHANFIGVLRSAAYLEGWHRRNVAFWSGVGDYAKEFGVTICIENMWEYSPNIIPDLLAELNHPNLRACLDVGHAHLYSATHHTLQEWLNAAEPWLIHTHINNNNGRADAHKALDAPEGVINYAEVLKLLRALPHPPHIILEMDSVDDMRRSLAFMQRT